MTPHRTFSFADQQALNASRLAEKAETQRDEYLARAAERRRLKKTHTLMASEIFGVHSGTCTACDWTVKLQPSAGAVQAAFNEEHGEL